MNKLFSAVKVLIWDFDGTLYPPNPKLWQAVREAEYKTIAVHTGWPREKVIAEFERYHKKVLPSATETVGKLAGITTTAAALEMEGYYDRRDYLKRDERLVTFFQHLGKLTHWMLANGVRHRIEETLALLGVPKETFVEIVTSEVVGVNKPHDAGFRYILDKTGLVPSEHLMIGDREQVDLAPAKGLGIKTCLVWSKTPGAIADATLPSVYDLPSLL